MLPVLAAGAGLLGAASLKHKMDQKQAMDEANAPEAQSQASQIEGMDEQSSMMMAAEARRKALQKEAVKQELAGLLRKFKAEANLDAKVEEKMSKEKK